MQLLFDLDGTLTDSSPGIIGTVRQTNPRSNQHRRLLQRYFAPTLDDRVTTKSALVRAALAAGTRERRDVAMIGDRAEDITAACENRIFSAAAAWGYGTSEEIADAKPDCVFHTITEYVHWIESRNVPINQRE